jgi:hypothetical protein
MTPAEVIESQAMIEAVDSLAINYSNTNNLGVPLAPT